MLTVFTAGFMYSFKPRGHGHCAPPAALPARLASVAVSKEEIKTRAQ